MINLMVSGNDRVADGLLIIVLSYLKHNKEPVTVYFLTMDLTQENPAFKKLSPKKADYINNILQERHDGSCLKVIDAGQVFIDYMEKSVNLKSVYTPYAMLRLFADLIPEIPDKILYLDADTLIADDISSLYKTDLEGKEFAAALDMVGSVWLHRWYMNSGVMLFNMTEVRKTGLFEKCRHFILHNLSFMPDQDALNYYVKNHVTLPMKYNQQGKVKPDTVIKHFPKTFLWLPFPHLRNIKPWMVEQVHSELKITCYDDVLDDFVSRREEFHKLEE